MSDQPQKKTLQEIIKEEYRTCLKDPVYFMRKYVKIQHPIRGTIPFELYPFQSKTLQEFVDNDFNIVLKSRQMGISTLVAAYSLWLMIFHKDKNVMIIATKQEVSKEIVSKVRFANDNLPSWLRVEEKENNRLSLYLTNGSKIVALSSATDAGRSAALSLLILDECAHIEKADEIWAAAQPTLSTGGKAILLSTPNGVGNFFHKMWLQAEEGRSKFNPIKLPWQLHPERDQKWRDEQDKVSENLKKTAQELDCDFLSSGATVIDLVLLDYFKKTYMVDPPTEVRGINKDYWLWTYPNYVDGVYIVTADVARGDGEDYSAFHVLDAKTMEQCAEYKGQVPTKDFGNMLVSVATDWNNALLIVERETYGWAVLQQIIDRKYGNLFYSTSDLQYVDVEQQMTNKINAEEKKMVPGFGTTMRTRPTIISNMCQYFVDKAITIRSKRTYSELEVFIWNNHKPQATSGYNDDLVMSLAIGIWVRDTALKLNIERQHMTRATLEGIKVQRNMQDPANLINKQKAATAWSMPASPHRSIIAPPGEDLKWLL
jgi:hypothetical protein